MLDMNAFMGALVPIAQFAAIALVLITALSVWQRNKLAQQETLRLLIQSGQPLNENINKLLVKPPASPDMDLRQGIISTCLALGFAAAAVFSTWVARYGELFTIVGMIAMIVASVGIGQLVSWKIRSSQTAPDLKS